MSAPRGGCPRARAWAAAGGALVAVAALVLWGTAVETSGLARAQYEAMTSLQRYDRAWFASRADHEFARLEVAVGEAAAGVGRPGDVGRWVDVMRNRLVLMADARDGRPDEGLVAGVSSALDRVAGEEPRLRDPGVARDVVEALRVVDRRLSAYAARAHEADAVRDHEDAQTLVGLHRAFETRVDRVMVCCLLLILCLAWHARMLHRSNRAEAALAGRLALTVGELDERGRLLDATLDNMAQGLLALDASGRVALCNGRFEAMFSLPAGSVVGRAGADLPSASPALAAALDWGAVLAGGTHEAEATTTLSTCAIGRPTPDGGVVVTVEDVTERRRAAGRLAYLALHDDLTGLANRHALDERIATVVAARGRAAVLAIDLDGFKGVNDGFGHAAGDEVLREVARRIQASVGEDGFVARMGGDEFAAVVGEGGGEPREVAERVLAAARRPVALADGGVVELGASVGIASHPRDGRTARDVMRSADLALYQAKADGKSVARVYDRGRGTALEERRALEADLHHAVGRDELVVHYQPIVRAADRSLCMREALVRWRHPTRGLVPPGKFIPIAEGNGDILAVGDWVLRRACADAAARGDGVGVAVNLSPRQFGGGAVVERVMDALERSGLAPSLLELEITETSILVDDAEALRTLRQVQGLGVRMSMDDFGTGYSSLSYLRRFPFDKVKIDQTFVHEIDRPESAAIVASMTALARELHVTTTAEGVETEEQARRLLDMGCDQFQGWLFGRPRPMARDAGRPRLVVANG